MRVRTTLFSAAALGILAVGGIPAQADTTPAGLTTYCEGVAFDVTVPGDLVVPEAASCDLENVTIDGDVIVEKAADLLIDDVDIVGRLDVQEDAYVDALDSHIRGAIDSQAAYGIYTDSSKVDEQALLEESGFLYSVATDHQRIESIEGEVYLQSSTVTSDVRTETSSFTEILDTWVGGSVRIEGATDGARLCESEVDDDAIFDGGSGVLQIGAEAPKADCGTSYVGGDLRIVENTGDSVVSDTIVRGDLNCVRNEPAPVGENNRVRGEVEGQCAELSPAAGPAIASETKDRDEEVLEKINERASDGERSAELAGPADIGS